MVVDDAVIHLSFSWAVSKLSARKYTGCISVMGYSCTTIFSGSNGSTAGLSETQCYSKKVPCIQIQTNSKCWCLSWQAED